MNVQQGCQRSAGQVSAELGFRHRHALQQCAASELDLASQTVLWIDMIIAISQIREQSRKMKLYKIAFSPIPKFYLTPRQVWIQVVWGLKF